jgi:hypothetical protein
LRNTETRMVLRGSKLNIGLGTSLATVAGAKMRQWKRRRA